MLDYLQSLGQLEVVFGDFGSLAWFVGPHYYSSLSLQNKVVLFYYRSSFPQLFSSKLPAT